MLVWMHDKWCSNNASGFQAHVKDVSPKVTFIHCFIHRFALCAEVLPLHLMSCLKLEAQIGHF